MTSAPPASIERFERLVQQQHAERDREHRDEIDEHGRARRADAAHAVVESTSAIGGAEDADEDERDPHAQRHGSGIAMPP